MCCNGMNKSGRSFAKCVLGFGEVVVRVRDETREKARGDEKSFMEMGKMLLLIWMQQQCGKMQTCRHLPERNCELCPK